MFRVFFYFKGVHCYQDVSADDTHQAQLTILQRFNDSVLNGVQAVSAPATPPEFSIFIQPTRVINVDFIAKRRIMTQ